MFTVNETAKKLRISRAKVYDLVQRRALGHYRIDGKILITDEDIQTFLAARKVDGIAPIRIRLRDVQV